MAWNITMLGIHLCAMFGLTALYKHAPDFIQVVGK